MIGDVFLKSVSVIVRLDVQQLVKLTETSQVCYSKKCLIINIQRDSVYRILVLFKITNKNKKPQLNILFELRVKQTILLEFLFTQSSKLVYNSQEQYNL